MNPLEKRENPYTSNEEVMMHSPYFESLTSGFPLPDFVNNYHYASQGVLLPQSHRSHYQSSPSELLNGSTQLLQPQHHQGPHHQAISGKLTNFNYESFGKLHATSSIYFPTDFQAQNSERVANLQSKSTSLELACTGTGIGDNSDLSQGKVGRSKYGKMFCSSNSQLGTTAVHGGRQSGGTTTGKHRIRWTHELHEQFVEAVNHLGGAMKATPKGILELMKSQGLTIFHIKSHLQKYRTPKCMPNFLGGKNEKRTNNDVMPISNFRGYGGVQISETIRLQMDIQKSLYEHLEFQKKLQMRIQEHANYLERMFDQQKRSCSCSFFDNHNSAKAVNLSIAECSSNGEYENTEEIILAKPEP